eukprot:1209223-Rhodomonas_salina.2
MDSAIKRGLGPPSGRHAFDPIQTDAAITHTDPYLVLVAILLMFLWYVLSFPSCKPITLSQTLDGESLATLFEWIPARGPFGERHLILTPRAGISPGRKAPDSHCAIHLIVEQRILN